ncbi:hypothetical protein ACHQM5_030041 [Ranunculus cassubicifolius]
MIMTLFSFLLSFSVLFCSICLLSRFSEAQVLGNETDRHALLSFKTQITQDPYHVTKTWNESNHFCRWEGVICGHKHQRVTVLNLNSKGLEGPISPYLGNLSFLRIVTLTNNSFHSNIPREIGKLLRLEQLLLDSNNLEGDIPVNISLCSNLKVLDLSTNNLVGKMPVELGSLSKLLNLSIENTKITGGIPSSFGNLTSLEALMLRENTLVGNIPSTLDKLTKLKILSLSNNNFSGMFPPSIYNLSTLEVLSIVDNNQTGKLPTNIDRMLPNIKVFLLSGNQFSGPIPTSLFNATKLQSIGLIDNHFFGKVPHNIGNLKDLRYLALQNNDLGSGEHGDLDFLTALTNCSKIEIVGLNSNKFGGMLPVSVGNFSDKLVYLYLGRNQISGTLPTELGNLQNLISLSLYSNFFSGTIPPSLGNLQKLQQITLSENQLSGQVPSTLRNMSRLFRLHFSYNYLDGNISSFLGIPVLEILDICCNNFSSFIPKEIGLPSRLTQLNLRNNSLIGSIPKEVGSLKNLFYFTVSDNKLSGELPFTITGCVNLQYIYVEGNSFEGPLPPKLDSLKDLDNLDFSRNNFSGKIPRELERLPFLTGLNLSINDFEGEVPTKGIFRNASAFSVLGNPNVCGGIPELGLPKCGIQRSERKGIHPRLKITLSVLIPSFTVATFLVIYLLRKPKTNSPSEQRSLIDLKRVSYHDLYKATNAFSSENLIGTGSYGSVYKGTIHQDQSPIAVKVLNLMEHGASKSFFVECEALRAIRHRNLLKILTICSSVDFNGRDFKALVFEYMSNGSLESWLHPSSYGGVERSLSFYQRVNIAVDIASALDYLHNHCGKDIAHCDLKSSNVLLDDDMTAHVGDFGLAKYLPKRMNTSSSDHDESTSIAVRGTIGYIPPEYGMGGEVSKKGDVYSYGILLLEMFTGKRPTAAMFKDGLTLHEFSNMALSHHVMDIIDTRLLTEENQNGTTTHIHQMEEFLRLVIRIGVSCSVDSVSERMDIKHVFEEMNSIKRTVNSLQATTKGKL